MQFGGRSTLMHSIPLREIVISVLQKQVSSVLENEIAVEPKVYYTPFVPSSKSKMVLLISKKFDTTPDIVKAC